MLSACSEIKPKHNLKLNKIAYKLVKKAVKTITITCKAGVFKTLSDIIAMFLSL